MLFCISIITLCILTPIVGYFYTDQIHTCIIGCPDNKILKIITYDINGKNKRERMKKPCIFNGWNLLHVLAHLVLTIMFPEYVILLFSGGIIWELMEIYYEVENYLDIIWNLIGIILGLIILKIINSSQK
jgi:Na+/glutamate symporter